MRSADWELLPQFLALARAGSLRAAAQLTGTNYGTLNRGVQSLEASYGVRLFHRSKRGFRLTEFGEALLPLAEEAEKKIVAARKRIEGQDKTEAGKIKFSITPTLAYDFIAPIVGRFSDAYPDIDIEFRLTPKIESITNDETDVSLRAADNVTEDVIARKLFQLRYGVYVGEEYLKNTVPNAGPGGAGLTWFGQSDEQDTDAWLSRSPFPNATVRHIVADGHMRTRLVEMNVGMSHLPSIFEHVLPNLRRMPGTETVPGTWLWILLHTELRKTVRVRRFVDFLTDELLALRNR